MSDTPVTVNDLLNQIVIGTSESNRIAIERVAVVQTDNALHPDDPVEQPSQTTEVLS